MPAIVFRIMIYIHNNNNNQTTIITTTIKQRKMAYFGHIIRKDGIQRLLLEGKHNGKRGRGRPRTMWMDNIKEWTELGYAECVRKAYNRKQWRSMIVQLLGADDTR